MTFTVRDKQTGKIVEAGAVWLEFGGDPHYEHKAGFWLSDDGCLSLCDAIGHEIGLGRKRFEVVPE